MVSGGVTRVPPEARIWRPKDLTLCDCVVKVLVLRWLGLSSVQLFSTGGQQPAEAFKRVLERISEVFIDAFQSCMMDSFSIFSLKSSPINLKKAEGTAVCPGFNGFHLPSQAPRPWHSALFWAASSSFRLLMKASSSCIWFRSSCWQQWSSSFKKCDVSLWPCSSLATVRRLALRQPLHHQLSLQCLSSGISPVVSDYSTSQELSCIRHVEGCQASPQLSFLSVFHHHACWHFPFLLIFLNLF